MIYPDGPGAQDTVYPASNCRASPAARFPPGTPGLTHGLYVHNKVILIDGTYQGVRGQKIVYATSQNLTKTSLRESNEVMLRIPIPAVYDAYSGNFEQIKRESVQIIGSAANTTAKTTAGVNSASEKRSNKAPKDNSPDPDE